jgi:hypothetical protein
VSYLAIREKRIRKVSRFHPRPLGRSARQDAYLSLSLNLQGRREPAQTRTPGADPGHPPQPAPAEPRFFLFEDKPIAERRARSARAPRSACQHLNPSPRKRKPGRLPQPPQTSPRDISHRVPARPHEALGPQNYRGDSALHGAFSLRGEKTLTTRAKTPCNADAPRKLARPKA